MRRKWMYTALYMKDASKKLKQGLSGSVKEPLYLTEEPYDIVEFFETSRNPDNYLVRSGVMGIAIPFSRLNKSKLVKTDGYIWNMKEPYIYNGVIAFKDMYLITDKDGLVGKLDELEKRSRFWQDR